VARALRRANLRRRGPVDHDIEFGGTEAVIGAAAAGLGVGFVSRWSIRAHLAAGWLHVVPGLDLIVRRTFCWALPTGALSGAARQFYEFAQRRPPS
jgi:DNA-binding transcriptional LysR family regulator